MDRARVERYTRMAQIGGATLLVAAVGVAVFPHGWAMGGLGQRPVAAAPTTSPQVVEKPKPAAMDAFEVGTLMAALSPDMPRDDPPAPPVAAGAEGPASPEPPPPPPPTWRYIGAILGPGWRKAIVVVNDQQKLVAEGESIDGRATLTRIEPARLVVTEGGVEHERALAPRQSQPEGAVSAEPRPMEAPGMNPGMNPGVNPNLNPGGNPGVNPGVIPGRGLNPLQPTKPGVKPAPRRPGSAVPGATNPTPGMPKARSHGSSPGAVRDEASAQVAGRTADSLYMQRKLRPGQPPEIGP